MVQITRDSAHMSTGMPAHPYKCVKTHTHRHHISQHGYHLTKSLGFIAKIDIVKTTDRALFIEIRHCTVKRALRIFLWQTNRRFWEKLKLVC